MNIELDEDRKNVVSIRIVGAGGGSNNAVEHMYHSGLNSVEFIPINADLHTLRFSSATYNGNRIQIKRK